MREKTLKIKGMRVPGLFIWLHGFFQGRITKTATVDEETGWISSSYITSKRKLFNELSAKRVKKLEQELKAVRMESFNLMLKESELRKKLEKNFVEIDSECSDIDKKRTIRSFQEQRVEDKKEYQEVIKRLGQIYSKIESSELNAREELNATASAIQSMFSIYGQGMLYRLGPVQDKMIPPIDYDRSFDLYIDTHKNETEQFRYLLKGVYDYEKCEDKSENDC